MRLSLNTSKTQVAERSIQLDNLEVLVRNFDQMTVFQMRGDARFTVLLAALPVTTLVHQARAVIGSSVSRELINTGSYVQLSASPGEVMYHIHN